MISVNNEVNEALFFRWIIYSLSAMVILSFPIHALVNPEQLPPLRFSLHFHAISYGTWFLLIGMQVTLISNSNVAVHRKLGYLSPIVVVCMLVSGTLVGLDNVERTGSYKIFISNIVNITAFLIFYGMALIKRMDKQWHKRMIVFASVALMLPVFARVTYIFQLNPFVALIFWIGYVAAIIVYDKKSTGEITKATKLALMVNIIQLVILMFIGPPDK